MHTKIRYTETIKQLLGMIIIPILYMGILVAVLFSFDLSKLSEAIEFGLIMVAVIIMLGASLFTIFRFIIEGGEAFFDNVGLHFKLKRRTFLYPHKDFFIPFGNIKVAGINQEPGKSKFINLETSTPSKSMIIYPEGMKDSAQFDDFWAGLNNEIERYNHTAPNEGAGIIKSKGFYESNWIKVLAVFTLGITAWLSFLKITDSEAVSAWKLLLLYCYALPFCFAVFRPK